MFARGSTMTVRVEVAVRPIIVRSDVVDASTTRQRQIVRCVTKTGAPRWDCAGGGRLVCLAANWISLSRFGRTKACVAGALFFCSRSPICLIRR